MARKSLIEAGSLLPRLKDEDQGEDVMSRVLSRDREKNGRRPPESTEANDITRLQDAHITTQQGISAYSNEYAQIPDSEDEQPSAPAAAQPAGQKRSSAAIRATAQKRARQMASSPAIPITLRLPTELNDFLDDAAHALRKKGVKKQDLVSRAVQLLVVALAEEGEVE